MCSSQHFQQTLTFSRDFARGQHQDWNLPQTLCSFDLLRVCIQEELPDIWDLGELLNLAINEFSLNLGSNTSRPRNSQALILNGFPLPGPEEMAPFPQTSCQASCYIMCNKSANNFATLTSIETFVCRAYVIIIAIIKKKGL